MKAMWGLLVERSLSWAVPWTQDEIINAFFLGVATLIVGAVPVVYLFKANLRDPLARAVLAGTGATAFVFTVTFVVTVAYHAGWHPDDTMLNWLTRVTYMTVALGKALFLFALWRAINDREASR